jgi:hypothetical protein
MGAASRIDVVRERLQEIKKEIATLDKNAKEGLLDMEDFARERTKLGDKKKLFEEEMHRLGL